MRRGAETVTESRMGRFLRWFDRAMLGLLMGLAARLIERRFLRSVAGKRTAG
jgi:hypothetical protein